MDKDEQLLIFSKNLRYLVDNSGKEQKDIAKSLGYKYTTFNTWYRGAAMPTASKIQTIADYFGVTVSFLLSENPDTTDGVALYVQPSWYTDPETARIAQEMFDDPQMRALFHMKQTMDPEKFQAHYDMMKKLYSMEHPDEDTGC